MPESPENVDPSKYLIDEEDEALRFSKTKLYRLHWGYGLSVEHISELCDIKGSSLRQRMRDRGIPLRDWRTHLKWEPHHGVPPMYRWDDTPDDDEIWGSDYKSHQDRKPEVSNV